MKIIYKFAKGEPQEIEVDETTYKNIKTIEREIHTSNKRHYRHDTTLEYEVEGKTDIEAEFLEKEQKEQLRKAMAFLSTEQKDLLNEVFFNGRQLKDIAAEQGVSYQAVQNRLAKILEKLRKNF